MAKLPKAIEAALAAGLARIERAPEANALTIRAAIQAINAELENAGFEVSRGFRVDARNGRIDLSGQNYVAKIEGN